jgi:anti-sigma B factor antagonist
MRIEKTESGRVLILEVLEKSLDASLSADFKGAITDEIQKGHKKIVLDLAHVTFMDSSALGAMVSVLKNMAPDGELVICGVRQAVMSVLALTRLDRIFKILPDQEQACYILSPGEGR